MQPLEEMTREEFLSHQLAEMLGDLCAARETGRAWTAVGHLHRQVLDVHAELTQLRAQREAEEARKAETSEALTDEETVNDMLQAIDDLPVHLLGALEDALSERRKAAAAKK